MTPTGDTKPKLLFYERASWYWVLTRRAGLRDGGLT